MHWWLDGSIIIYVAMARSKRLKPWALGNVDVNTICLDASPKAKICRHGFNWITFWNVFQIVSACHDLLNYWAPFHPSLQYSPIPKHHTWNSGRYPHPKDSHLLSFWHVLQGKVSNLCHGFIGIPARSSNASFFRGITDITIDHPWVIPDLI